VKKIGLSFGDEEENEESGQAPTRKSVKKAKTGPSAAGKTSTPDNDDDEVPTTLVKKRLKPSSSVSIIAKAQTKSALAREAQLKESLRKQYLATNEAVRATEFILPFVFFEAKDMAGGKVRLKKGDFVWLLLERARKIGIELGERGEGPMGLGGRRREWARIGVDDLMVVVGEMMVPHVSLFLLIGKAISYPKTCVCDKLTMFYLQHLDFHSLILNSSAGYNGVLFPFSSEPTAATPAHLIPAADGSLPDPMSPSSGLLTADQLKSDQPATIPDAELEGFDRDPTLLKVVDRRWYEKNKHIYPMSVWEDFDPAKDYSDGGKKDREGNAFFFSSR
jgi:protein FAM50